MQRYQWLLFDADGTLFDYKVAESSALSRAFAMTGIAFKPDYLAIYQRINHGLWCAVEKGELTPTVVKVRRFEQLLETIQAAYSPVTLRANYLECLAGCSELILNAAEVLETLHGKYRMAILTNGLQTVQRRRLAGSQICQYITDIIISEEIGFSKPAKEFFDIALAQLGHVSRRDVLMIGDGWGSDIQGALQFGIDACWYNPDRKPCPPGSGIIREIASLPELVGWLG
jgi:2-haloacid dehalogenase